MAQGDLPEALKSFRDQLAIADRLARADPDNADWQRDRVGVVRPFGDVLIAQGDLAEALKSFNDGLAIRQRLARTDPDNAVWQRDLSVAHSRVGDVTDGTGQSARGAEILQRAARDCRPAGAH